MSHTVLFVHGTGVREPTYTLTLAKIKTAIEDDDCGIKVERCYWGGTEGCALLAGGASIPSYIFARAPDAALSLEERESDETSARWTLLSIDPWTELSQLEPAVQMKRGPGVNLEWQDLRSACLRFSYAGNYSGDAERHSLLDHLARCAQEVGTSREFIALQAAEPTALRMAVARTIVATAFECSLNPRDPRALYNTAQDLWSFDRLESLSLEIADSLVLRPARSIVPSPLSRMVKGLALAWGTRYVKRRRGSLSDKASLGSGDILKYQARGNGIRRFIASRIVDIRAERPNDKIVLLAHSLGGIACVDLLSQSEAQADLLITVGSQAPLLYELNALWGLQFADLVEMESRLPEWFPCWHNIWDPRDFLSYVGGEIFGKRCIDYLVDNKRSFPDSHSAYWENTQVFTHIKDTVLSMETAV